MEIFKQKAVFTALFATSIICSGVALAKVSEAPPVASASPSRMIQVSVSFGEASLEEADATLGAVAYKQANLTETHLAVTHLGSNVGFLYSWTAQPDLTDTSQSAFTKAGAGGNVVKSGRQAIYATYAYGISQNWMSATNFSVRAGVGYSKEAAVWTANAKKESTGLTYRLDGKMEFTFANLHNVMHHHNSDQRLSVFLEAGYVWMPDYDVTWAGPMNLTFNSSGYTWSGGISYKF